VLRRVRHIRRHPKYPFHYSFTPFRPVLLYGQAARAGNLPFLECAAGSFCSAFNLSLPFITFHVPRFTFHVPRSTFHVLLFVFAVAVIFCISAFKQLNSLKSNPKRCTKAREPHSKAPLTLRKRLNRIFHALPACLQQAGLPIEWAEVTDRRAFGDIPYELSSSQPLSFDCDMTKG